MVVMGIGHNILKSLDLESRPSLEEILNRNASALFVGVELEYLVLCGNKPATLNDYRKILFELQSCWKNTELVHIGDVTTLIRTIDENFRIEVKPDFSYNVVEISLGKGTFQNLKIHLSSTLADLSLAIASAGLNIHCASFKKLNREEIKISSWGHLVGYLKQFPDIDKPFGSSWYPAEIAAAQVHLDILSSDYFELAVFLYLQEFIFLKDFTQLVNVNGIPTPARYKSYEDGLGQKYLAKTVPECIYRNSAEYIRMIEETPHLFTADPICPVKDLSFIRPRAYGSVEFRSACTSTDPNYIEALVIARFSQLICAVKLKESIIQKRSDLNMLPRIFWEIQTGERKRTGSEDFLKLMESIENMYRTTVTAVSNDLTYGPSRRRLSRNIA